MRGNLDSEKYQGLSQSFFAAVGEICHRLVELTVEEYSIDANKVRKEIENNNRNGCAHGLTTDSFYSKFQQVQITDFPKTIEKLSLKGCRVFNLQTEKSYFFRMDLHMPNLTVRQQ